MAKRDKTDRVLGTLRGRNTAKANEMILPNNSGDHVRSIKRQVPVDDVDLTNKAYVDLKADGIDPNHTHSKLVASDGSPDPAVSVDADGKVGIGTATPETNLHIKGSGIQRMTLESSGTKAIYQAEVPDFTSHDVGIFLYEGAFTAPSKAWTIGNIATFLADDKLSIAYYDGGSWTTKMVVQPDGKIGIGTDAPDVDLHIVSTANVKNLLETTGNQAIFQAQVSDFTNKDAGFIMYQGDHSAPSKAWGFGNFSFINADKFTFGYYNGAAWSSPMVILEDGKVGIGVTDPAEMLEVKGWMHLEDGANQVGLKIHRSGVYIGDWSAGVGHMKFKARNNNDIQIVDDSDNGIILKDGGKVGIGTAAPDWNLHVKSADHTGIYFESTGVARSAFFRVADKTLAATGAGGYYQWAKKDGEEYLKLVFYDGTSAITPLVVDYDGNVGIGTTAPTQPLSVKEKVSMTAIGGIAIMLTNETGANTVQGQLVKADTATNDAVILTGITEQETIGVFLESGIADGQEAWVVISGIADVAMEDNTAATRGNWVQTSDTVGEEGYADSTNASPPGGGVVQLDNHMQEIGHCIESVAAGGGGTHILARCVLHFN